MVHFILHGPGLMGANIRILLPILLSKIQYDNILNMKYNIEIVKSAKNDLEYV